MNAPTPAQGWFVVTRRLRHRTARTFLRLTVSTTDYTRAARRFLTDNAGKRWTVGKRIG